MCIWRELLDLFRLLLFVQQPLQFCIRIRLKDKTLEGNLPKTSIVQHEIACLALCLQLAVEASAFFWTFAMFEWGQKNSGPGGGANTWPIDVVIGQWVISVPLCATAKSWFFFFRTGSLSTHFLESRANIDFSHSWVVDRQTGQAD